MHESTIALDTEHGNLMHHDAVIGSRGSAMLLSRHVMTDIPASWLCDAMLHPDPTSENNVEEMSS